MADCKDYKVVAEYQETINGILYNTKRIETDSAIIFTHDPVRTPEQAEKRRKVLEDALGEYSRALLKAKGYEWCMDHLACRDRKTVAAVYAEAGKQIPDYYEKYLI